MTAENRKILGKLWKDGKIKGDFEAYYNEFKDEISKVEPKKKAKKEE